MENKVIGYSDYIFITEVIDGPGSLPVLTGTEADKELDRRDVVETESSVKSVKINEKFKADHKLKYAYHVTFVTSNRLLVWLLRTEIYFFHTKEELLDAIRGYEFETWKTMDKENIANNQFIFINTHS